jgi:hypothetical protein
MRRVTNKNDLIVDKMIHLVTSKGVNTRPFNIKFRFWAKHCLDTGTDNLFLFLMFRIGILAKL